MLSILDEPEIRQQAYPVSVAFYQELGRLGLIEEETELLEEVIVIKPSKSPLHQLIIRRLQRLLQAALGDGYFIDRDAPITCVDSEPEPDIAVFAGEMEAFTTRHPSTAKLVIEVSINTLRRDRRKAAIYAKAGVKEYWLVEPAKRSITLFTAPVSEAYGESTVHSDAEHVTSTAVPGFKVSLAELFAE